MQEIPVSGNSDGESAPDMARLIEALREKEDRIRVLQERVEALTDLLAKRIAQEHEGSEGHLRQLTKS